MAVTELKSPNMPGRGSRQEHIILKGLRTRNTVLLEAIALQWQLVLRGVGKCVRLVNVS